MSKKENESKSSYYWYYPEELQRITDKNDPLFDPRVLLPADEGLVQSIIEHGVQEPLAIVTRTRGEAPCVADGRRRHAAALEANRRLKKAGNDKDALVKLPCLHVRGVKPEDAMVIRHSHRLDESPLERARKAQAMLARGYTEDDVALKHGVSVQTIAYWMDGLKAPQEAIVKHGQGELSFAALVELGKVEPAKQTEAMAAIKEVSESDGGRKKGRIIEAVRDVKKGKKKRPTTEPEGEATRSPLGRAKIRAVCEALAPTKDDDVDPDSPEELAHRLMRVVTGDGTAALLKNWPNVARAVREALK